MKRASSFLMIFLLLNTMTIASSADDIESGITEAEKLANGGDVTGAVAILEKLAADNSNNSDVMAYLGLYTGMSAGQTQDYAEAGRLMSLSFERLDNAVQLDENNPRAWLFRGIMGIKMPAFLGKLDAGIGDLEHAAKLYSSYSSPEATEGLVTSLTMLAEAYGKKEDPAGQKKVLEKIIVVTPGTEAAEAAKMDLERIGDVEAKPAQDTGLLSPVKGDSENVLALKKSIEKDPENTALILELGRAYYNDESFAEARETLKYFVGTDRTNAEAYKLLALSTARIADVGYDEEIYDNTDYRSGLAFETMDNLDKAVALSPDDIELRHTRGIFGLLMPFFLGKHEQSVEDLEMVVESEAPESIRSEALYYLGYAHQREAMRYWIKTAKEYPGSPGAKLAFEGMRPHVARFDESGYEDPHVKIDFVLGFQDELAPQTAVWIEGENEEYIVTIYVSGFAGYVKEKQVTLPVWSAVSKHEGLDGITSASIDIGHHIFVWDLMDHKGNKVKKGTYTIRVETSHWPSMLYQNIEALIEVGRKESRVKVEEGDFIPYLEVTYVK